MPERDFRFNTSPQGSVPLDVLGLSTRAYNALRRAGIHTVAEVVSLSDERILDIRQIGTKTLKEIRKKLTDYLDKYPLPERIQSKKTEENPVILSEETHIGILKLSCEVYEALWQAHILTLGQLVRMSQQEILNLETIDDKGLAEIELKLQPYRTLLSEQAVPFESITSGSDSRTPVSVNAAIDVLGLSTRPCNALKRGGISTIKELVQMSSEQILGIYNIGEKSLIEIEEKLEAYLERHSLHTFVPVKSEAPTSMIDPDLRKRVDCLPLNEIAVKRLGLPDAWRSRMLQADIVTVGELVAQPAGAFGEESSLKERLERYLIWLIEQDEVVWADEVAGRGISPLHWIELSQNSLDELIEDWLSSSGDIDDRDRQVIYWRYGLGGDRFTLESIGRRLDLSRERVRQLEKRTLGYLSRLEGLEIICPLMRLLLHLLGQSGGLMGEEHIEDAIKRNLHVDNIDSVGVTHLVLEVSSDAKWLGRTKAWGLKSTPLKEVTGIQKRLVRALEKECVPLPIDEVVTCFKKTRFYRNRHENLEDDFILACLRVHPEVSIDGDGRCGLKRWEHHRLDEMILALREIGEPAHYTEIAEKTNDLLEPEMRTSAHNIHAHMQRLPDIFARVGHGIYGLKEWGLHNDGSVANAAHRVLSEAGKPLHYDIIADRVLETWCVNRASVYAAMQSDDRFVSIGQGIYWLREKIANDDDAEVADFGDLFGNRLEQWQGDLNIEDDTPGYDTHAEADAIRKMGTDFFK